MNAFSAGNLLTSVPMTANVMVLMCAWAPALWCTDLLTHSRNNGCEIYYTDEIYIQSILFVKGARSMIVVACLYFFIILCLLADIVIFLLYILLNIHYCVLTINLLMWTNKTMKKKHVRHFVRSAHKAPTNSSEKKNLLAVSRQVWTQLVNRSSFELTRERILR